MILDSLLVGKGIPARLVDHYRARTAVIGAAAGRWFEADPHCVSHVGNASAGASGWIVLDAVRYDRADWNLLRDHDVERAALTRTNTLHRSTLGPSSRAVSEGEIDDRGAEFPVDSLAPGARTGTFISLAAQRSSSSTPAPARLRCTTSAALGTRGEWDGRVRRAGKGERTTGGCCLAIATHEDPGVPSERLALDAAGATGKPVAPVRLPRRVPAGFHGSWIPDVELKEHRQ